ncbi:TPA: HEAT repeat domain-containing protein [Klebsiella aerogenes]
MNDAKSIINKYRSMSDSEKIEYLRGFNSSLDLMLANFLVDIVKDKSEDELLRIEAVKILGLYRGEYNDELIKKELLKLIVDEDEELKVYIINAFSLMNISESDIDFFLSIIRGEYYILVKEAAFSLLVYHKNSTPAHNALNELLNDETFGKSAKRELNL